MSSRDAIKKHGVTLRPLVARLGEHPRGQASNGSTLEIWRASTPVRIAVIRADTFWWRHFRMICPR